MSALDTQVGGDHYKKLAIQPLEYIMANQFDFCTANIIKYASRWRNKGGIEDLKKVIHYAQFLIEQHNKTWAVDIATSEELFGDEKPDRVTKGLLGAGFTPAQINEMAADWQPFEPEQPGLFEDPWGTGDASDAAAAYYPKLKR
jgi:hypothetical protein